MRHLVPQLLLGLSLVSSAAGAEHTLEYDPPDILSCDDLGSLGLALSSDSCVLAHSYVFVGVGYDSSAGFVSNHEAHLRLGLVRETDIGPFFAVATVTSAPDFFWDEYVPPVIVVETGGGDVGFLGGGTTDWGYTSGAPRFDEAFMGLGDAVRVQVGKVETILNLDDDEPLDVAQTLLGGVRWSFKVQPWLLSSEKGYSPSVQLIAAVGESVTVKLGSGPINLLR